jgi:putative membrane protein insertion efficiency factor
MKFFLFLIIVALCGGGSNACQSCLADLTRGLLLGGEYLGTAKQHHEHHDRDVDRKHHHVAAVAAPLTSSSLPLALRKPMLYGRGLIGKGVDTSGIGLLAVRKCIAAMSYQRRNDRQLQTNTLMIQQQHDAILQQKRGNNIWLRILFASDANNESVASEDDGDVKSSDADNKVMSSSMIMAIGFYKKFISPLLPPACRFLPTCSQYGVQAIEKYGPQKGLVLTAWRLARCSPFGGKGYDPPIWPPVSYTHGSY